MEPSKLESLKGKVIITTRAKEQQSVLCNLLSEIGAEVLDLPALIVGPPSNWNALDSALQDLNNFNWIIFSSANGVNAVDARLKILGKSLARCQKNLKIAAVGKKTENCLKELGANVNFVPPDFVAESLIKHFPSIDTNVKILLPRVESGGRNLIASSFNDQGAKVTEVAAYETCCPEDMPDITAKFISQGQVDAITFTSGKTVKHAVKLLDAKLGKQWKKSFAKIKIISIGPQTSINCYRYFNKIDEEANPHNIEGLVSACIKALGSS